MKRREAIKAMSVAAGAATAGPMFNVGRYRLFAASQQEYSARAVALMWIISTTSPTW